MQIIDREVKTVTRVPSFCRGWHDLVPRLLSMSLYLDIALLKKIVKVESIMIRNIKQRLKRRNRTILAKHWILRRDDQGDYSNLVQKLVQEDSSIFEAHVAPSLISSETTC